jgi:hypothetical protein
MTSAPAFGPELREEVAEKFALEMRAGRKAVSLVTPQIRTNI